MRIRDSQSIGDAAVLFVGRRIRVDDRPVGPQPGRVGIMLERGAFGSGEHETTASCLEILETLHELDGAAVLDLGSGTGVLAIAAVKLGAARAMCIDRNPRAVTTARRNADLNGVAGRIAHLQGVLADLGPAVFDVAIANLYADVLLDVADDLVGRVRPGGTLVLSGIVRESDFDVRQRFGSLGCTIVRHRMLEEYSTLLLQAPGSSRSTAVQESPP